MTPSRRSGVTPSTWHDSTTNQALFLLAVEHEGQVQPGGELEDGRKWQADHRQPGDASRQTPGPPGPQHTGPQHTRHTDHTAPHSHTTKHRPQATHIPQTTQTKPRSVLTCRTQALNAAKATQASIMKEIQTACTDIRKLCSGFNFANELLPVIQSMRVKANGITSVQVSSRPSGVQVGGLRNTHVAYH